MPWRPGHFIPPPKRITSLSLNARTDKARHKKSPAMIGKEAYALRKVTILANSWSLNRTAVSLSSPQI